MARDYTYDTKYESSPEQRRNRSSRNKARRLISKALGKDAVKGLDVDHKDGQPLNNSLKNLRVTSKSKNRARKK